MDPLEKLELFLRAQLESQRPVRVTAGAVEIHPFVTISRQAGAGGHSLATALLEAFSRQPDVEIFGGWQVFDQRLCQIVADDPMYAKWLDPLLREEYRRGPDDFFHQVLRSTVDQDYVMARVFEVVRAVASIGKAIIVGRAGSQVTADMEPGVHLRIVGPEPQRIRKVMEVYDLDERRARSEARRLDARRARLLKAHFGADIDDPLGYDAMWNTGSSSVEDIAEATVALLRRRVGASQPA